MTKSLEITTPEQFDTAVKETIDRYFKDPMIQAIEDGTTPPVLVEALLRTAYTALDVAAQDNRQDIGPAFRKLADGVASYFEEKDA